MSYRRFTTNRDRGRRITEPDSAIKQPFPRIHSRSRAGSEKSASSTSSKSSRDSKESVRDKGSRQSTATDSDYGRNDSATTNGSNFSEDTTEYRIRSPTTCQCSCHDRDGRRRSTSRDRRGSSSSSNGRNRNSGSPNGRNRNSGSPNGRNRNSGSPNGRNRNSDSAEDGDGRMPPININDTRATRSNKGSFFNRDPSSRYRARSDSKTSQFRITSVDSDKKRRDKPPFKYYGGRSLSTGDLRSLGGIKNDYDYAREGFLTPRFTSEYKARYEMKHGQRYTVGSDRVIRYIDPAGEHLLIPKDSSQLQRTVSDSDISSSVHSRNNRNVKLEPLDRKSTPTGNKGAAPSENKQWLPTKKSSANSLPPMEKTPVVPDTSRQPSPRSNNVPHPLGLNTPPKRNTQLYPM